MTKLTIFHSLSGDWEVLFDGDGKFVAQGHEITLETILDVLGVDVEWEHLEDDNNLLYKHGSVPEDWDVNKLKKEWL